MAELPDIPKGRDLEWSVAAALQCSGYYIDKNVAEQYEGTELLELDAVATRYGTDGRSEMLIEVKSGQDWKFGDLFELRGRMHYRDIDEGIFFATQCSEVRRTAYDTVANRLGIKFILCPDARTAGVQGALKSANVEIANDVDEHDFWRFVYWAERNLVDLLVEINRGAQTRTPVSIRAKRYHQLINNRVFFTIGDIERANDLYAAFSDFPHVSNEAVKESLGGTPTEIQVRADYFDCMKKGKRPLVQVCLYLEHRARLAILRAAVDFARFRHDKDLKQTLRFASLPNNFTGVVQSLERDEHAPLYPYFWQVFFWAWGGFIIVKNKDAEYEALSQQTGVPVDAIDKAIEIYGQLFPISNGWLQQRGSDELLTLKLMPPAIHGLGAIHRLTRSGTQDYAKLGVGAQAQREMIKWHNLAVGLIERKGIYASPAIPIAQRV